MEIYNEFTEREDIGSFNYSDSQSNASNEEYYNTLTNVFIKFFNKYSNCNNYPLLSISKAGRTFIENLNFPNFGWKKEVIFEYEGLEYDLEFRTVLDRIHQTLLNNSITEEFVIKYKMSTDKVSDEC
ncbi:zn-finger domain-containing protein [Gigaspora margarita]|uniref:Zn-finger domain-containing protein n=1 Tax=Gigaspora margarita TaxID=4874 RepID=A0A8H4AHJ6_GIGMA|nr:zn-finger domain-containing protein [Gigaspora margarita]